MPRPIRSPQQGPQGVPVGNIREDIRALNSSILLITQKMKYLVRNEKILGRNLIVLNKKIKALDDKINEGNLEEKQSLASITEIEKLSNRIESLENENADLRSRMASKEDFKEIKFVVDSINPLEFASLSQVRELIDKRMDELKKRDINNSISNQNK
jgi:predicted RNase H-like nuclease (RuvC/YqgF family)